MRKENRKVFVFARIAELAVNRPLAEDEVQFVLFGFQFVTLAFAASRSDGDLRRSRFLINGLLNSGPDANPAFGDE